MFLSASSRHREHEKSLNNSLLMYMRASANQWSSDRLILKLGMGFERIERGELQSERQRYRGGFVVSSTWEVAIIPHLMLRAEGG